MTENNLLSLIIFAPLFGAIANWIYGGWLKQRNETISGFIACAAIGVSTVVAFMIAFGIGTPHTGALFMEEGKPILDHIWTWIQVGDFRADFGLGMDRLSGIYVCFVTFVGLLIHIFATGYMHGDKGFYRFFAYLNLFMFAMLTLVLADNFLLMFVGWEGVGLCSYLLIGYYLKKDEARKAAKKAFVMNRIGDWGVLMGIFLLFTLTGSISFFDKPAFEVESAIKLASQFPADPFTWGAIFAGGLTTVGVLLFIGATGKSAQIPLFVWLPDAMAGPTPVSALIHAATMVTAGIYLVVRCSGLYVNAPTAMFIIAIIGAATALVAATIGLAQNDIKKVLAYSTVSQLGYMFLACGVGAFIIAIFHVMTHAFFKALLFLGSGSVIHGMHHEQDMRKMGNLKKYMPITWITMCTGWLAIAGIPIWAGFFSKDEILYYTFTATNLPYGWNIFLWVIGFLTAGLTAVYMTRMMLMTFWGEERFHDQTDDEMHLSDHSEEEIVDESILVETTDAGDELLIDDDDDHDHHHIPPDFKPHESPWTMTVPLIVLAFLSTFGGLIGISHAITYQFGGGDINYFKKTLKPVVAKVKTEKAPEEKEIKKFFAAESGDKKEKVDPGKFFGEFVLAIFSVIWAIIGIGIGVWLFYKTPLRKMPKILENKWYVDEFYNKYIVDPITNISRQGLWKGFDVGVIDGIVNGIGQFVVAIGSVARSIQVGFVRSYVAFMLFGALLVIGYFIYYGFKLIG